MIIIHNFQFISIAFFIFIGFSKSENEISVHYKHRGTRSLKSNDNIIGSLLTRIIVFVIYTIFILLFCGMVKAILGLCFESINLLGLDIFNLPRKCRWTTIFLINIIFFLAYPFCLLCDTINRCRCQEQQKFSVFQPKSRRRSRLAGGHDVYDDDNDSENQDTKYVLEQLYASEHSLTTLELNDI